MTIRSIHLVGLALLVACGHAPSTAIAKPQVDTLTSGLIEVKNDGPSAWVDTNGWKLVEVGRLRQAPGTPSEISQVGGIATDHAGHVYVLDAGSTRVLEFDSAGSFIRAIGRKGDGPGEFQWGMLAVVRDTLVLQDGGEARMSLFDSTGRYIRSFHSECCFGGQFFADTAGLLYVRTYPKDRQSDDVAFLRFRTDGSLVDTIELHSPQPVKKWVSEQKGMRATFNIPYAPSFLADPDGRGGMVVAWTGSYRVVVLSHGRDSSRAFSLRTEPTPLSSGLRDSIAARFAKIPQLASIARASDVPDHAPAFDFMSRDPAGDFWLLAGVQASRRYDVFSSDGVYLGKVAPPKGMFGSASWAGDLLYVGGLDKNDLPAVYIYRLDRRGR